MRTSFPVFWSIVFSALLAVSFHSARAVAETKKAQPNQSVLIVDTVRIPGPAISAMSDIYNARVALFDGNTDTAMELLNSARGYFNKNLSQYTMKLSDQPGYGVPIDGSASFGEDFVPNKKQAEILKKSGDMVKKEGVSAAYKAMIAAGIELNFKFALLPVASTIKSLDKTIADMKEKRYYKANLELKAIELSIVIEDFGAYETPKQGYSWEVVAKS